MRNNFELELSGSLDADAMGTGLDELIDKENNILVIVTLTDTRLSAELSTNGRRAKMEI